MAINNFKPFALDPNANVTSQADWEALPALLSGFTAGKASSAQVNKAIRQASFIAAALAQYTANKSGLDVLDDGDLNGFISKMGTAFGKDFQALDATLSALAGLATGANKLPYFTGNDTAAQTDLTSVGRDIIGKNTIADILTYLGLVDDSGVVGRLLNTQVITSSGTYTPTPGTRKIKVILTGGGGGGSSVIATSFSQTAFGGGGGSAATCIGIFDLEDISDFSVVIGAGGTAGNPGGTSTFNGMSAGRGGGGSGVNTPATGTGGTAGTATGGLINIHGGHGSDGQLGSYYSFGNGAASFWGGGGRAGAANGIAAKAYGAGGGAAYDTSFSGALKAGGTGAPGVCVIEEFA